MLAILETRENLKKEEIPTIIISLKALLEESLDDLEEGLENLDVIEDKEHEPLFKKFLETTKINLTTFSQIISEKKPNPTSLDAFTVKCKKIAAATKKQYQEIAISGLDEESKQFILKILNKLLSKIDRQSTQNQKAISQTSINLKQQLAISALFENTLSEVKETMDGYPPTCFISYAWGVKRHEDFVHQLGYQLIAAGININLDVLHNNRLGSHIPDFVAEVKRCTYAIVVGTPMLMEKYNSVGSVVKTELDLLADKHKNAPDKVIKLQLDGEATSVFPIWLGGSTRVYLDCRQSNNYYEQVIQLLDKLYENGRSEQQSKLRAICDKFKKQKDLILNNRVHEDLLNAFAKAKAENQAKSEAELLTKIRTVLSISRKSEETTGKQSPKTAEAFMEVVVRSPK